MSLNYQKDPAAQVPTLATGLDGVDSVVSFYENGTSELKNLLKNECSVIFECSYCRSLFRSIVNFVSHKRTICRSLQSAVVRQELEFAAKRALEVQDKNAASTSKGCKRNPNSLRRVNLASLLGKHIQTQPVELEEANASIELQTLPKISRAIPFTSFKDGQQIVDVPSSMALKLNQMPEGRTVLVMPQDNSIRYREMQLRTRRKEAAAKTVVGREFSTAEVEILNRIPSTLSGLADFQQFRCIHEDCAESVQPFVSLEILAHHLAICHQKEQLEESCPLYCFICGDSFDKLQLLGNHFRTVHAAERLTHVQQRVAVVEKQPSLLSRKGRSSAGLQRASPIDEKPLRFRSISPLEAFEREQSVDGRKLSGNDRDRSSSAAGDGGTVTLEEVPTSSLSVTASGVTATSNGSRSPSRTSPRKFGATSTQTSTTFVRAFLSQSQSGQAMMKKRKLSGSSATAAVSVPEEDSLATLNPQLATAIRQLPERSARKRARMNVSSPSAAASSSQKVTKKLSPVGAVEDASGVESPEVVATQNTAKSAPERPAFGSSINDVLNISSDEARKIDELLMSKRNEKDKSFCVDNDDDDDDNEAAPTLVKQKKVSSPNKSKNVSNLEEPSNDGAIDTDDAQQKQFGLSYSAEGGGMRRQTLRSRKPTKRFFNDQFVVDPTAHHNEQEKPTDAEKKDSPSGSIITSPRDGKKDTSATLSAAGGGSGGGGKRGRRKATAAAVKKAAAKGTPVIAGIINNCSSGDDGEKTSEIMSKIQGGDSTLDSCEDEKKKCEITKAASLPKLERYDATPDETTLLKTRIINNVSKTPQKAISEPPDVLTPLTTDGDDNCYGVRILPGDEAADKQRRSHSEVPPTISETSSDRAASIIPVVGASSDSDKSKQEGLSNGFVLPNGSPSKRNQLPSILADRSRENLAFYTPKARRARLEDEEHRLANLSATGASTSSSGSSRRKQNLLALRNAESDRMVDKAPPKRPDDLTEVPVYLTEVQRDIFFAPLRPLFNPPQMDGLHQCGECGEMLRSIRDGRRHMVGHLRVMRIRCSLCEAGAFFCSDMRVHLMFRHCENLHLAPPGFVEPNGVVPCMDKKKADTLTNLVDPYHPGRVMYTSGKIVSWSNPRPYYPDPRIEERILGAARPHRASPASQQPLVISASAPISSKVLTQSSPPQPPVSVPQPLSAQGKLPVVLLQPCDEVAANVVIIADGDELHEVDVDGGHKECQQQPEEQKQQKDTNGHDAPAPTEITNGSSMNAAATMNNYNMTNEAAFLPFKL